MSDQTNPVDAMLRAAHNRGVIAPPDEAAAQEPPTPRPLPGGGAAPHVVPVVPAGSDIIRAAVAAARGEGIPHHMRPFVEGDGGTATVRGIQ